MARRTVERHPAAVGGGDALHDREAQPGPIGTTTGSTAGEALEDPCLVGLLDPGSGVAEAELLANLERAGVRLADVRGVLLTHCHVDHAMGAGRLQRHGLRVFASAPTAAK